MKGSFILTDYVQKKIAPGVELLAVPAGRFKTNELAIHLAVPMEEQMAANYALAISAVSRKGKAYPDMRALHLQLDKLYGAAISVTANKSGGCQILKIGITTLDDRFALDDEKIAEAGLELLMNLLFDPLLGEDGLFSPADIETERRVLLEKLAAEENENACTRSCKCSRLCLPAIRTGLIPKAPKRLCWLPRRRA